MIRAIVVLSLLPLVASLPGVAEAAVAPSISRLISADADRKALQTPAGRNELTNAVKGYCDEVGSVYPRNSPAEDKWLSGEVEGGGNRVNRALESPEWGRRQASIFLEGCQTFTDYLSKGEHSKGYAGLAYTFTRFSEDSEALARKNNVDPERLGLPIIPRLTIEALLLAALASPP